MCFLKHSIKSIKAAKAVIQTLFSCLWHTASAESHCRLTATATERGIWIMRPTTGPSIDSNAFQFMTPFTEMNFLKIGWGCSFSRSDIYSSPLPIHCSNLSVEITTIHDWITQHFLPPPSFSNLFLHTPELRKVSSWTLHTLSFCSSELGRFGVLSTGWKWENALQLHGAAGHLSPLMSPEPPSVRLGSGWSSGGTHMEPESL